MKWYCLPSKVGAGAITSPQRVLFASSLNPIWVVPKAPEVGTRLNLPYFSNFFEKISQILLSPLFPLFFAFTKTFSFLQIKKYAC